jgi:hypothetical protein
MDQEFCCLSMALQCIGVVELAKIEARMALRRDEPLKVAEARFPATSKPPRFLPDKTESSRRLHLSNSFVLTDCMHVHGLLSLVNSINHDGIVTMIQRR